MSDRIKEMQVSFQNMLANSNCTENQKLTSEIVLKYICDTVPTILLPTIGIDGEVYLIGKTLTFSTFR